MACCLEIPYNSPMDVKNLTKLDWDNLRYFLALATSGTLLGAARSLGVEHATVGRRVSLLEDQLRMKLIDRRGRRIQLTAEGERIAAMARRMGDEALAIEQARLSGERLAGTVRISAPPALSTFLLAEPIVRLRRLHPDIDIVLAGEKQYASLNRREADIAVRLARPEQGELTITRLGGVTFNFYAAPSYLAETAKEAWSFISYGGDMENSPQYQRLIEVAAGRRIGIKASTLEFQLAAARAGGGIAILPDFIVGDEAGLVRAIDEEEPVTRDIWLVVHSDIRDVPIIRAVIDVIKG
jgi:DNA-binding transcriptional LysR family regulator